MSSREGYTTGVAVRANSARFSAASHRSEGHRSLGLLAGHRFAVGDLLDIRIEGIGKMVDVALLVEGADHTRARWTPTLCSRQPSCSNACGNPHDRSRPEAPQTRCRVADLNSRAPRDAHSRPASAKQKLRRQSEGRLQRRLDFETDSVSAEMSADGCYSAGGGSIGLSRPDRADE
jgi:hypothetical protein